MRLRSQPLPFLCPPADSGPAAGGGLRAGTLRPPPLSFNETHVFISGLEPQSSREALCGGCGRHLRKSATLWRDGRSEDHSSVRPQRDPYLRQGWSAGSLQTERPSPVAGPFLQHRPPRHPALSVLVSPGPQPPHAVVLAARGTRAAGCCGRGWRSPLLPPFTWPPRTPSRPQAVGAARGRRLQGPSPVSTSFRTLHLCNQQPLAVPGNF